VEVPPLPIERVESVDKESKSKETGKKKKGVPGRPPSKKKSVASKY
jgi:hypothetical protein